MYFLYLVALMLNDFLKKWVTLILVVVLSNVILIRV